MEYSLPNWVSSIADILGILGFLISSFLTYKVYNINANNNTNSIQLKDTEIGGDFVGRDKNA